MPVLQKLQHWSDPTDACEFWTSFSKPVLKVQFTELCTYNPTSPDLEVSACWMPKQLKPEQQAMHLMTCLDSLHCYDTETEVMMERVVTGDVSYHYKPSRAGKNRFARPNRFESIRFGESNWYFSIRCSLITQYTLVTSSCLSIGSQSHNLLSCPSCPSLSVSSF